MSMTVEERELRTRMLFAVQGLMLAIGLLLGLFERTIAVHLTRWILERVFREPFVMSALDVVGASIRTTFLGSVVQRLKSLKHLPRSIASPKRRDPEFVIDLEREDPYQVLLKLQEQHVGSLYWEDDGAFESERLLHDRRVDERYMELISDPLIEAHLPSFAINHTHFNLDWYAMWKANKGRDMPLASDPMFRREG